MIKQNVSSAVKSASTTLFMIATLVLLICVAVDTTVADSDYAISPVSLLLPYSTSKFRKPYKLEANKGCFEWVNTNPDLIEITPIFESDSCGPNPSNKENTLPSTSDISSLWDSNLDNGNNKKRCSKSVLVHVRSGSLAERNSAFIYAEEQSTGKRLQCEVFVDRISSIVIETTTKTMYKDDLEELFVRAYDSVGNVFSSIIGLEFEWSIASGNIIQIVPFRGFPLDDVALKMEQEGLQTSFVLVQGVDTGRTEVTTKLTDTTYSNIQHSTTLSILEPLQLNPSYLLYVTPGTQIQYSLLTKKRTILENIPLPNPNYIWSSSNPKTGVVENSGLFMALDYGKTDLRVQHRNMSDNKVQALVNVVKPSYLALKIEPIKSNMGPISNWNLIENRDYILTVELYDASGHKIYSNDITFDLQIPTEFFEPIPASQIPAHKSSSDTFYLRAIKQGGGEIKASLLKVYDLEKKNYVPLLNPISVDQLFSIHSQIVINPPIVYLPHIPGSQERQKFTLKPSGGSGEYNWFTNGSAIATVDSTGTIQCQSSPGQTEIIAVDKKNNHNRDIVRVIVLKPNEISIVPSVVEIEVGKKLALSSQLLSPHLPKGLSFDSCVLPDLDWRVEDETVFKPQSNHIEPALEKCSSREFLALKEGSTVVTVQFMGMKAQVRIFAFPPLKSDAENIILSIGSSAEVFFRGGPDPWYLEPKTYFRSITNDHSDHTKFISIAHGNGNSFKVTCLQQTNANSFVTIVVGNKKSSSNPFPAAPSVVIPYSCEAPASVQLQVYHPEQEQQDLVPSPQESAEHNTCLDNLFTIKKQKGVDRGTYKIRNNRDIPFIAEVYNESGKKFTNYSSLLFEWKSADNNKARWIGDDNFDHLSKLSLFDQEGKVTVSVSIVGYNKEVLNKLKVKPAALDSNKLKSTLELSLLSSVKLSPENTVLYLSEKNPLRIDAFGGSKSFEFTSNNSKIASLTYQPNSDFATITPLQQGYLMVNVRDVCLGGHGEQKSSPSYVQISEVHSIDLQVAEMVQVGDMIHLTIKAFSTNGREFGNNQYQFMNIVPHIDNPNVLSIVPSMDNPQTFKLKGLDQGLVTLSVSIVNPKTSYSVTSKTVQIQVFPPFKVSPTTLHLVPGGHSQIHWTGGAPIRQDVRFESSDPSIVTLGDINGELVALKVGQTTIQATAEITDPITHKKSIIGQDKLTVYVKNMTGIRIHSSINKILVGDEAKLRVVGANGETPFTYGTVDLFFKWESVDTNIATLAPIYEKANTTVELEGSFSVRVVGKSAGSTTITVWAYSGNDRSKHLFQSASLQITVIPDVPIPTTTLLLPLNTASNYFVNNIHDKSGIEFLPLLDGLGSASCKDVVDINNDKIVTLDKIGTCYLSVVRDRRMDTSKLVRVNSKPFSHIEVLPLNPTSSVIPIGDSMSFAVYLRDDIGELFTEYGSSVTFITEVSNSGIIGATIEVTPSSYAIISVKGLRAGLVTLRVYLKDMPHLDDYVKIFVGRLVDPDSPLVHIGSNSEFTISKEQLTQRGYSLPSSNEKIWSSADPSIISIDPVSGKCVAKKDGKTTIHYIRNPSSQTSVTVSAIADIQIEFGKQVINNTNDRYSYPLKFYNKEHREFTSLSNIQQNIKGSCSVKETGFANAYFETLVVQGKEVYNCVVQPTGTPTSSIDKVTLFVQVSDQGRNYIFEKSFDLPFEATFSVLNSKSKILLTLKQKSFILNIQSPKPIFIESSDISLLSVQQLPSTDQDTKNNVHRYLLQPMNPSSSTGFSNVPLFISNPDGKNKQTIFVTYSTTSTSGSVADFGGATGFSQTYIFTFIVATLMVAIGVYISRRLSQKPRVYISNNHLNNSNGPMSSSSLNNSGFGSSVSSPYRTPPPQSFMSPNRSQYNSNLAQSAFGNSNYTPSSSIYLSESKLR
ncbi:hypothetical protein CYY_007225 [Polysphondylium violaceum]|uniref:BIG2 domain-containing protein n=1 Tax=Polysphondylium violaceum TaxID=133409 RepID=A0A8J4PR35_9MYCE|nr:hypothetical protein CYY_007225 [Polysphondylium violaceum]